MLLFGGLRFAIPVMLLVAAALAVATYLDSTLGARAAARWVYGSGWFIALMALVCVSLVCAVVTRYPWRRRHVGFITVHAGLIVIIVGGFWSLLGRVEGQMRLFEGVSATEFEINTYRLELLDAKGATVDAVSADERVHGALPVGGLDLRVVEHWANSAEEEFVADDAPEPLRAFEITTGTETGKGIWLAESPGAGKPAFLGGLGVRVLGAAENWTPPPVPDADGYVFVTGDTRRPLPAEGGEVVDGWTVSSLRRFRSAMVDANGQLEENESGEPNPAVEVRIINRRGSIERHIVFDRFPDMTLGRLLEGDTVSGAQLRFAGPGVESLVLFGAPPNISAAYTAADGSVERFECDGTLPWTFRPGDRDFTILGQATHARKATRIVEAPPAGSTRPALVLRVDGGEPFPIRWKSPAPVPGTAQALLFGPRRVAVPFEVRLVDFRKADYPGTTTAMAYESEVAITTPDGQSRQRTISMNNPYAYADWKLYQSGFQGDNVSIFSVMKDPGLPVTYAGCVILCVGICVTFYSRTFSTPHPGIAGAPAGEEPTP